MALILNIETTTKVCSVSLSQDANIIAIEESTLGNNQSLLLSSFIENIFKKVELKITDIDAIAISKGPGSYTGLRIGVSMAKGLCYALEKPLISVNTLQSMASSMSKNLKEKDITEDYLLCPMIDARRMEVYSAIYDMNNKLIRETKAEIISKDSFIEYLDSYKILIFGDGAAKCKTILTHSNIISYENFIVSSQSLAPLAEYKYQRKEFENTLYFEPYYLKDFMTTIPKNKIFQN
jgi:tRNA threonylcarbamoyladenosine biosynthesis protein TsaB